MARSKFHPLSLVRFPRSFARVMIFYICVLLGIVAASVLSGCSPRVRYVPVEVRSESVSLDSVRASLVSSDTVIMADTVRIVLSEAGDTVRMSQIRWRDRVSIVRDTVASLRVDTLYRERAVQVEVPAEESKAMGIFDWIYIFAAVAAFGWYIWSLIKLHREDKNNS